jgi:sugar phosphate isomerase/epimerase
MSRREAIQTSSVAAALGARHVLGSSSASAREATQQSEPFRYCFNTSTIRGQQLGIVAELEIVSRAGYDGIEPWISEIDEYVRGGGSLEDLRKRIADSGLRVESAIGFSPWIADDPGDRARGLETARREMEWVRAIGGTRIAAPPAGEGNPPAGLMEVASRYRALLELGQSVGVVPQLEVWGFSRTLPRLGDAAFVAIESGHPWACLLPDIYHLYKGGSDFEGLKLISGHAIHVFHVNDYPSMPPRDIIRDEHRVYPGDGIAPFRQVLGNLIANGFQGALSLELFNRDLWAKDALEVARVGLEKMREVVGKGFNS